jgi:hypothetical protein
MKEGKLNPGPDEKALILRGQLNNGAAGKMTNTPLLAST